MILLNIFWFGWSCFSTTSELGWKWWKHRYCFVGFYILSPVVGKRLLGPFFTLRSTSMCNSIFNGRQRFLWSCGKMAIESKSCCHFQFLILIIIAGDGRVQTSGWSQNFTGTPSPLSIYHGYGDACNFLLWLLQLLRGCHKFCGL